VPANGRADQTHTAEHALARVNGATPEASAGAGCKGFKAEVDELRKRMRKLGMGYDEIAAEIARRYRLRPRESYRLAWGWSLNHAAARFNALAAHEGTVRQGRAGLTGPDLGEMEKWPLAPSGGRKPSVYVLLMLAQMYETGVLSLLDLADHENLAPQDRRTLLRPQPLPPGPFGERLAALMNERGLPLTEVARRIPCSRQYLSNIAHGRKGASERVAALLDRVLDAGGELVTLAATTEPPNRDQRKPKPVGDQPAETPVLPPTSAEGLSLSLPYVPGRLVIEISEPAGSAGQIAPGTSVTGQLALVQDLPRPGQRDSSA
jgi:transcriptional regulator with XRE-family HTH domain